MKNQPLHPRTAAINDKQKNHSKRARHHALNWLAKRFPKAFDASAAIHPLKIGIIDDILLHAEEAEKSGISKSKLREAVVLFTRRVDYLTCLKLREMRIDLNGDPTTQVSAEEAERAALKIKRRIEKSTKNARTTKAPSQKHAPPEAHAYEPPPTFNLQQTSMSHINTQAVMIKHKTVRSLDPNAVARLKEKLGLAQKGQATTTS